MTEPGVNDSPCGNCKKPRGGVRPADCLGHWARMCERDEECTLAEHEETEPCQGECGRLIWDHVPEKRVRTLGNPRAWGTW